MWVEGLESFFDVENADGCLDPGLRREIGEGGEGIATFRPRYHHYRHPVEKRDPGPVGKGTGMKFLLGVMATIQKPIIA